MITYGRDKALCKINWLCIYLEVYWLSDLATGGGKRVETCYVEGTKNGARRSKYTWRKEQPEMLDKISWVEFIQQLLDERGVLLRQLGDWLEGGDQRWTWITKHNRREITNLLDSNEVTLYRQVNTGTRTQHTQYDLVGPISYGTSLVYKVSVTRRHDGSVEIDSGCRRRVIPP